VLVIEGEPIGQAEAVALPWNGIQEVDGSIPFGSTIENKRFMIEKGGHRGPLNLYLTPF